MGGDTEVAAIAAGITGQVADKPFHKKQNPVHELTGFA
jgi:hypothetical protein